MSTAIAADQVETYHLELKPTPSDPLKRRQGVDRSPIYRLKSLLKEAARTHGFRIRWAAKPACEPVEVQPLGSDMIRFKDGPAAGQTLMLRRAPLFLRVTFDPLTCKWDALDQLHDQVSAGEAVWVYRRIGKPSAAMIDWTEKGRRRGGCFAMASYEVVQDSPPDAVLRDTEQWREWCWSQVRSKQEPTREPDRPKDQRRPAQGTPVG